MEAGIEFVLWLAMELFGEIVGANRPWWVKALASLGCLVAAVILIAAILLLAWAIIRAGGEIIS